MRRFILLPFVLLVACSNGDDTMPMTTPGVDGGTGTGTPSAADMALAQRLVTAWDQSYSAECPCIFMEEGYADAAECQADVAGGADAAYLSCVAGAISGGSSVVECMITATNQFATCTQGLGTNCMDESCWTAYQQAEMACGALPNPAALQACDGGEE